MKLRAALPVFVVCMQKQNAQADQNLRWAHTSKERTFLTMRLLSTLSVNNLVVVSVQQIGSCFFFFFFFFLSLNFEDILN